jgi:hypothetical protein
MLGKESPYNAVCRIFNELAFQNKTDKDSLTFQEQNMIEVRMLNFIFVEYNRFPV